MCNCTCNRQHAELELRRELEAAQRSLACYADMNGGGRWGHGRGNFTGKVAAARSRLETAQRALRTITGRS